MILYRYIFKEHIPHFFFSLSLIIFIFLMNTLLKMLNKIAGKGIPILTVLEFFALSLAWILALAVPMAVLTATIAAYGRLAGDGEITALRASGISATQLIKPALFGGIVVTLWSMYFMNFMLPDLNHRTKLLQIDISRKKPTLSIEPNLFNFDIPNYVLLAKEIDREKGYLYDLTIYDEHDPENYSTITAKRGKLEFVEAMEAVVMTLNEGEIHRPSEREPEGYEHTRFDSALFRLEVPGMVLKRGNQAGRGDRELKVKDLLARIEEIKDNDTEFSRRRVSAYKVEIHKKFSIPAACLVFVLIGAPLGMLARRGGMGVSFAISLIFFTVYWVFLGAGEDYADRGQLSPSVSMWMANAVLAIIGFYFLWLAKRRTSLPGMHFLVNLYHRLFSARESRKTLDNRTNHNEPS